MIQFATRTKRSLLTRAATAFLLAAVATTPMASAQSDAEIPASDIRDLIVKQTREINPTTAAEILHAVDNLVNVQAYEVANEYLQKVLEFDLKPAQMAALHKEFGTLFFLKLLRTDPIRELGSQVTDRITLGADQYLRDPVQLERTVRKVASDQADTRRKAAAIIQQIGAAAVPRLLNALASGEYDENERRRLASALKGIGKPAVGPLVAALASDKTEMLEQAIFHLRALHAQSAVPYLLRPALDPKLPDSVRQRASRAVHSMTGVANSSFESAEKFLRFEIDRILTDPVAVPGDINDQSRLWIWSPEDEEIQRRTLPRDFAATLLAEWLASDLMRLNPADHRNRQLFLAAHLGWTKLNSGLDEPMPQADLDRRIDGFGFVSNEVDEALSRALKQRNIPTAIAAAELLGRMGDVGLINSGRGTASPLACALRDSNQRVRFAAVEAILQLDPRQPFVGASDLVGSIVYAATASGRRKILVAHTNFEQTGTLAGLLRTLGYDPIAASNGKQALRIARQDPDIEIILISDTVDRAPWQQTVQQLAFDHYSSQTPICIVTSSQRLTSAENFAARFDSVTAFPFPHDHTSVTSLLRQVLPLTETYATSAGYRLEIAGRALQSMGVLLEHRSRYAFYEFLPHEERLLTTMATPALGSRAAFVLGYLATPAAQTALVEFAGQSGQVLEDRREAAAALERAIRRAGIMLTQTQILQQYERYNEFLAADEDSATILGLVLDSIERPSQNQ